MMCLSTISADMPIVPSLCPGNHRHVSVKKIIHLSSMPIVPRVYQSIAYARMRAREIYTYTLGTIGIGIKCLFCLTKLCPGLPGHRLGTIGADFLICRYVKNINRYYLGVGVIRRRSSADFSSCFVKSWALYLYIIQSLMDNLRFYLLIIDGFIYSKISKKIHFLIIMMFLKRIP